MDSTNDSAAPPRGTHETGVSAPMSRRTIVSGAAWAVPAVLLTTTTPAYAVSSTKLSVSTPSMQVPASGDVTVTAKLTGSSGAVISFTGPAGSTLSPASATTDGSGNTTTQFNLRSPWATPGSTATINAVSGSETKSQPLTVRGSNLVIAGQGYTSSLAQSELVFPSRVVDALSSGGTEPWYLVLLADGSVWSRGHNSDGQLGDGTQTSRWVWAKIPGLSGVKQIAASYVSGYALLSNGSVKAWGYNYAGNLGDRSFTPRTSPVDVWSLSSGVTHIAAAGMAAFAVVNGAVKAWGENNSGQLGNGTSDVSWEPVSVSNLSTVTQLAAAAQSIYALLADGSVYSWGYNGGGQLGDATTTDRRKPVQVSGLTSGVTQIAAGGDTGYALLGNGSVQAWGQNSNSTIGDNTTANRLTPVQVSGLTSGVTQIAAGRRTGYALSADGVLRSWGAGDQGQAGNGSTSTRPTPSPVALPNGRVPLRIGVGSSYSTTAMVMVKTD